MIKAITYILNNNVTVQGLVGKNAADNKWKIYPVMAPITEVESYITVRLVGKNLIGRGGCGYTYRFQVTSYAVNYDDVTALNNAVVSAITSQTAGTVNGVAISFINFVTEHDEATVDRIAVTFEHALYMKVATFEGTAD